MSDDIKPVILQPTPERRFIESALPGWVKLLPSILAIGVVAGGLYGAFAFGSHVTCQKYKAIIATSNLAHANETISLKAQVATAEHKANAAMDAIAQHQQDDLTHAQNNTAATLAGYASGVNRLRDEFKSHCGANPGLPDASTGTSGSNEAASGGLQPKHVEFLVRLAGRADEVALQLQACQAVIKADRDVVVKP